MKSGNYFASFDILRLFVFLLIFAHHLQIPLKFIIDNGWIGVDILFVLSGFLVTYLLLKEREKTGSISLKNFFVRRILRIWPLYFLYLLLIGHYRETWSYFLFLGNWKIIFQGWGDFTLVGHLWAISVEEQFYFMWPLILIYLKSFKLLLLASVLLIIFPLFLRLFITGNYLNAYLNTFARIDTFGWGILLATLYFYKHNFKLSKNYLFLVGLFILSLFFVDIRDNINPVFRTIGYTLVGSTGFLTINALMTTNDRSAKLLSQLGRLGYGLYVWHKIGLDATANPILKLVITFLLAIISFNFWEQPFLRLKSKFRFATVNDNASRGTTSRK